MGVAGGCGRVIVSLHVNLLLGRITDIIYRLKHYKLKPISDAYLHVRIWFFHTSTANPMTGEVMGGFVALATLSHRNGDFSSIE